MACCDAPLKIGGIAEGKRTDQALPALSDGDFQALTVLSDLVDAGDLLTLDILDEKHLYGPRIWDVYHDVCGGDLERFRYHVAMELPCQACGELFVTGPYATRISRDADAEGVFFAARQDGRPGANWALIDPPADPHYIYPLGPPEVP